MILCYRIGMRLIGIDYGTKRVGLAVSDEAGHFALPRTVIANTPTLLYEVRKIAVDEGVQEIVIGESRQYDMSANRILPEILAFKQALEEGGLKVHLELEFMTSVQAGRWQGKTDKLDASAAAIILQSFLDRRAQVAPAKDQDQS